MSDHFIDLKRAIELTTIYRNNRQLMLAPDFSQSLHLSETFDAAAIKAILDQPGCVKFRSYFGMDEEKKTCLIFVGVNANDEDMVEGVYAQGVLVEYGDKCPPECPPASPLNA
jgi:hypothetical protein